MELFAFLLQVFLISLSGVMTPGPVSAVTMGKGSRSPHAGAFIALGHGVVEVPLIAALIFGMGMLLSMPPVKAIIGLAGGGILLMMAIDMLRSVNTGGISGRDSTRPPFVDGIILSAGNPYFIIWWATLGMTLINGSIGFGISGIIAFVVLHWLCDFGWLYFLSALSFHGGRFFGNIFQKAVFAVCGVVLCFFGVKFIYDATVGLLTLWRPAY